MKYLVFETPLEAERYAANRIAEIISFRPDCVLGLATGATMEGVYAELVRLYRARQVSFHFCTTFNLDEYIGLPPHDRNSYHFFMKKNLFSQVDLEPDRAHVPDGCAADLAQACAEYEEMIRKAGGLDLQLLGIGHSGHIGFNEPGSAADSKTRVVELCEETMRQNGIYFDAARGEKMPGRAVSMGLGTILAARELLLIATGSRKAEIIRKALQGEISTAVPASLIQRHPDLTVVLDREAAAKLA